MFDSLTNKRITVWTDGVAGAYVTVPKDQVGCVKEIFDRADLSFTVSESGIRLNGERVEEVISLGRADPIAVQKLLDEAVVKVSINFVDGGFREYYEGYDLIERYESLRQEGLEGKALVHELFTDDWGHPPVGIRLEGRYKDNRAFRAHIAYR